MRHFAQGSLLVENLCLVVEDSGGDDDDALLRTETSPRERQLKVQCEEARALAALAEARALAAEARVADAASRTDVATVSADQDVVICATRPTAGHEEVIERTTRCVLDGVGASRARLIIVGGAATLTVPGAEGISYYRGRFSHRRPRHADRAQAGIGHDGKFDELWELAQIEDDY